MSDWQAGLSESHLICRDLHHAWQYQTVARVEEGFERRLLCQSCGTRRIQRLDRDGYLLGSRYEYPEGYVRPAGAGVMSKDENASLRLINLQTRAPRRRRA